jgi:6-pyruvoyl-tetrahydropterin synthase
VSGREIQAQTSPGAATLNLARTDIGFSAAHFSILEGRSERLHGHNYRVSLRATGDVHADGTVIDFTVLKRTLRMACAELDERTLLPALSPDLSIKEGEREVEVTHESRRFVFPRSDVRLLPIVNTTCECLAAHLLELVHAGLGERSIRLELRVEESPGQGASAAD